VLEFISLIFGVGRAFIGVKESLNLPLAKGPQIERLTGQSFGGFMMKKFSIALLALAASFAATPAARASSFAFTFTTPGYGVIATGSLTGTEVGSTGVYDIISGFVDLVVDGTTVGSGSITGTGVDGSDNMLTPGATGVNPLVSFGGLSFDFDGAFVNIYSGDQTLGEGFLGMGSLTYGIQDGTPCLGVVDDLNGELTMATAAAPEPSSLLFLGTGFLALAFLAFRKVKPSAGLVMQA
jgi:PEP-CTERM motif